MSKPDWKCPDDYVHLKTEKRPEVWAWELLKRYGLYQQAYATYAALTYAEKQKVFFHPPIRDNETEEIWRYRCETEHGLTGKKFTQGGWLAREAGWLLRDMYDPAINFDDGVQFTAKLDRVPIFIEKPDDFDRFFDKEEVLYEDGQHFEIDRINENYVLVAIDVARPITDQISIVKEAVDQKMKAGLKQGKVTPGEGYIKYLRALDALSAQHSPSKQEMGAVFYSASSGKEAIDQIDGLIREARKKQKNYKNLIYGFHRERI